MSAAAAAPMRAASETITASTRSGVVIRSYINAQVDALNSAIAATERHAPGSAGSVRIAIHRLRTAIRGYEHLFTQTPHGGPQLDQLLAALKHTEDLERLRVHFADRFDQLGLTVPEYPKWYAALEEEMRESYRMIERVHSQAWVAVLLGQVRMFAEHAHFTRDGDKPASSLMGVLSQAKAHLLDTYGKLSYATDLATARDQARVAAREARFLAEAAEPALGRAAEDVLVPVSALEHLLTQYRQALVARNWLLRLPGSDRADRLTASLADLEREHLHQLGEEIDAAATAMVDRWR
ncbi:CHAD domain-containing protein [Glycomyces harbinensis]|uniref:CHAD domain-containing protein n=1 Tax=Glycomyces harbinensis TaxID=58114 RepID=A0A1G7CWS8_9ACTN|nr:CHAD domain-containing protein [Glycomyces harbinensis]SDE43772.1 CHAD domain-containing protein [Glycomyces harbinensis]